MCGIVGYVGSRQAVPILLEGLRSLEYRGYDSAGIAVVGVDGMRVLKRAGKVAGLAAEAGDARWGTVGIAHTRWATHGEPNEVNAHPHLDERGRIAVVHNGIIENATALRDELLAAGVQLRSDTDSELLAHLIARLDGSDLERAVRLALRRVEGTYGIAVLDALRPDRIVVARSGSPVVIGIGDGEHIVASDAAPIVGVTRQVVYLEDGELATVTSTRVHLSDLAGSDHRTSVHAVGWEVTTPDVGNHVHHLHKEIVEQPDAVTRTLDGRIDHLGATTRFDLPLSGRELAGVRRVSFLGCGSAYYAGRIGARLVEQLARIPADAEPASEFRYRDPVIDPGTLYVALSQSGETLDTIRAVQSVQEQGAPVAGVINVEGSSLARLCDSVVPLHAGTEVSVTSTKTFTSTAVALALLAVRLGRLRGLDARDGRRLLRGLESLPEVLAATLLADDAAAAAAEWLHLAPSAYFIGRVGGYPVALEGAQKLKEVAYVHAEAYPASELKHGPLSLITPWMPTVAVLPDDDLVAKNMSTIEEIKARGGRVLAVGHRPEDASDGELLLVPRTEPELDPIVLTVPLQLLAYRTALLLDVDIDKPRNLAKSVTVE